jgi:hypothetical protein
MVESGRELNAVQNDSANEQYGESVGEGGTGALLSTYVREWDTD